MDSSHFASLAGDENSPIDLAIGPRTTLADPPTRDASRYTMCTVSGSIPRGRKRPSKMPTLAAGVAPVSLGLRGAEVSQGAPQSRFPGTLTRLVSLSVRWDPSDPNDFIGGQAISALNVQGGASPFPVPDSPQFPVRCSLGSLH
jgi:hypothetical protein